MPKFHQGVPCVVISARDEIEGIWLGTFRHKRVDYNIVQLPKGGASLSKCLPHLGAELEFAGYALDTPHVITPRCDNSNTMVVG